MKTEKHAYLIMAHDNFKVLEALIAALDVSENDLFIHVDKKVRMPTLRPTRFASCHVLKERVAVTWGDFSQIEAEYRLFEEAYAASSTYSYFHLISGTHFPLQSQGHVHQFFDSQSADAFISPLYTDDYEVRFKLGRHHFFLRHYRSTHRSVARISQWLWKAALKAQRILGVRKRVPDVRLKAQNWVSVSARFVSLLLQEKQAVGHYFRSSFCGDEFLVPFILERHPSLVWKNAEKLLFTEFVGSSPRPITREDLRSLLDSSYLFARKITDQHLDVATAIEKGRRS